MPVNHQVKSQLAKLLATEDLVVEHRKVDTAQFNVHTRVLTLPMWERASSTVYDMLVGHEVGHALYTPDEDWLKKVKISPSIVNIVEDARVEKLMKRRYAGLAKTFYNGYKELSDEDFFQLGDDNLDTYNLADRANLWFKIGNYVNIPIERGEEMEIINMIADTETFADVLIAAEALYNYCKKQDESEKETVNQTTQDEGGSTQDGGEKKQETVAEKDDSSEDSSSENKVEQEDINLDENTQETEETYQPETKTVESLSNSILDLIEYDSKENIYIELPKVNLNTVIKSNSTIHEYIQDHWKPFEGDEFKYIDHEFNKFKKNAQKEINYLVKEFECRKAADSYARATTARTGVLDCSKLHTYKYNEDLFKKVTTLADGKNHGLVFVLDWSGSMGHVMMDTLKQLYNILWFCRKVNVPFDVYAFSNEWNPYMHLRHRTTETLPVKHYVPKDGLVAIGSEFSLLQIFTSGVKGNVIEQQMRNIFRIANSFKNYSSYSVPPAMCLSGTPLNESLISLHQIIPQFKTKNKVQKVQCVILTDGEAPPLPYHVEVKHHEDGESYIGCRGARNAFLRNRKTGMIYSINMNSYVSYNEYTNALLYDLRDSFKNVNFIGIRIVAPRDASNFIRMNTTAEKYIDVMTTWKKDRSFSLNETGYHRYFGMSSTAISSDSEFVVSEDASKSAIRNAFKKSLKNKKMNKKFLTEFIKMVA